jgi:hypothetical protein
VVNGMAYTYDEGGGQECGPNFGCIHHEVVT